MCTFHKRAVISSPIVKTNTVIQGYAKFALIRVYKDTQSFPQARVVADEELLLDLHLLSVNVAQVMLIAWLLEMESTCIKEETPYEQLWCLHSFDFVVNSL